MTSEEWAQTSGSGPFINSRKRAPIVLGAGRASRSAAASGPAAATNPDAASPATRTNSRLFVFLAMITPQVVVSTLNRHSQDDLVERNITIFWGSLATNSPFTCFSPSEIRLVRCRDRGFLSREPVGVFGANSFRPVGEAAPVSHGRGPRRREDAFVLDRELELQILAHMVRVPDPLGELIFLCVSFQPLFRGFVIKQPISFDHVQSLCVWRAIPVDHGKRPDLDPDGVYYQRVAFIAAHGIAVPGRW